MRILFLNQGPRGPSVSNDDIAEIESLLRSYASPGVEIIYQFVEDFPGAMVHEVQGKEQALNGLYHQLAVPSIVRAVVKACDAGVDAVIQSNTFDPGVEAARLSVSIPVIGLMRTTLAVAATLADRIGVIAPLDSDIPSAWRTICAYKMDHFVVGMKAHNIYSADIKLRRQEIFDQTVAMAKDLVRNGAQVIIPLGGRIIPYIVDPKDIEEATGAPVLNTKAIGIRYAEMCVSLGLRHSPLAYPVCVARPEHFGMYAFKANGGET